jgi:hypothetical protein
MEGVEFLVLRHERLVLSLATAIEPDAGSVSTGCRHG